MLRAPLIIAVALPFALLALVLVFGVNVPYADEWWWGDLLYKLRTGSMTFGDLWAPHNEHRILVARLMMLGLAQLGGWDVVREQCLTVAFVAASQIVLWRLIRRSVDCSVLPLVFLVASLLLYSLAQIENFESGFQTSWLLCTFALLLCVDVLTRRDLTVPAFICAVVVAVLAGFSSSQGLLIWPAGAVAILLVGVRVAQRLVPWVISGTITVIVEQYGLPGHAGPSSAAHQLADLAAYVLTYLGAPLAGFAGILPSAIVGAATLAVVIGLFVRDARRRDDSLAADAAWYALACYALLAGAATAYARIALGVGQALSPRYATNAILLDIALVVLVFPLVAAGRAPALRALVGAALAAVVVMTVVIDVRGFDGWRRWSGARQADARAVVHGDLAALNDDYPEPYWIPRFLQELSAIHEGPFHP